MTEQFNGKKNGERKWESKPESRTRENLPPPTPPKSSLTQPDDSSMFRVSRCWLGESHRRTNPSIPDVSFPLSVTSRFPNVPVIIWIVFLFQ